MAFRFALAALLRFRQSLEHQAEILLQEANHDIEAVRKRIEHSDCALGEMAKQNADKLHSGVTAAELQFDLISRSLLLHHRELLHEEMIMREEIRTQRFHSFQQARQQREVVETLRERQLEIYRQQEAWQEQRRLDDHFLLRREFLRRR